MKLIPITLLLVTLLSGCQSQDTPQISTQVDSTHQEENTSETERIEEIGEIIATSFHTGDYPTILSYFDDTLLEILDENTLESSWNSTISTLGAYWGEKTITAEGNTISVLEEYELQNLLLTLVFDEEEKVSGINLNFASHRPKPTETTLFFEEEVTIGEESFPLDGFLTLPKGVERPPVVLLVQGSGPNDRNSTIFQNVPLQDIAHGLAEQGIASFRYDKRFFTYPEEGERLGFSATLEEEILIDVDFALEMLGNEGRFGEIYVLGHSLGGMLTPAIAAEHDQVQGIISMAGSPKPLYEISYQQNKDSVAFATENTTDEDILEMIYQQMEQVEADIVTLRGDFSHLPGDTILMGLSAAYQQSVKDNAGENFLGELSIPMLILQGSEDIQISATEDYTAYQNLLETRENVTFKLYEGLNHLMMEMEIRDVSDYQEKGQVSPVVIEDIANFIHEQ